MKLAKQYIPNKGDIIWLELSPQMGHEQAKLRPGLVLSPLLYNQKTSLCLVCPITSKVKGYPFEVEMLLGNKKSVILADQIKSLDWVARNATYKELCPEFILEEVIAKLKVLL